MSLEIVAVLSILGIALVLFVTERVRMDVVALMVMCTLALTGLVAPTEAISGFSNPAVITVWGMFILSDGLSRTGVANLLGTNVLRIAGRSETRMIAVVMITAGVLSGFMNNIGVAALMLPVVVDVARRSGLEASRLLMPLAYGTLLGGLTTLVGTPPNLLVSNALTEAGLAPFGMFDFTAVGLPVLIVGTVFVATIGRHLLPRTTRSEPETKREAALDVQYGLQERMFMVRIPGGGGLEGRTVADLGLASSAGLVIIALMRADGSTQVLPNPRIAVGAGDTLLVQGRMDRFEALRKWRELEIEHESDVLKMMLSDRLAVWELEVDAGSRLIGEPVRHADFRQRFNINILAVRRGDEVRQLRLAEMRLAAGDRLLVQCTTEGASELEKNDEFSASVRVSGEQLNAIYALKERVFTLHVPPESDLEGMSVSETRLGDAFDFRLLAIYRDGELLTMPSGSEAVARDDLLIVQGRTEDIDVLRRLQRIEVLRDVAPPMDPFKSEALQMVEVTLHPHSSLAGKLISELDIRDRYQVEIAAVWRNGRPYRSELADMRLRNGDALLMIGPRESLAALNSNEDFIVLTPVVYTPVDTSKAPVAGALMLGVVAVVLLGWLPISIAAVSGATLMVLTRCLSMEEAYRSIDWRSIFLIAGMLPLGIAMEQSGAAHLIAAGVMATLGTYGAWPVIGGLYGLTALATMIIPTAALVVLMAPIVLSASADMGTSPHTGMMAIALAASASFTSPISHPANVLVMGPGGYRFADYLKLGVPLTIVVFLVVAALLGFVWPLVGLLD